MNELKNSTSLYEAFNIAMKKAGITSRTNTHAFRYLQSATGYTDQEKSSPTVENFRNATPEVIAFLLDPTRKTLCPEYFKPPSGIRYKPELIINALRMLCDSYDKEIPPNWAAGIAEYERLQQEMDARINRRGNRGNKAPKPELGDDLPLEQVIEILKNDTRVVINRESIERAIKALEELGVTTVGELMNTPLSRADEVSEETAPAVQRLVSLIKHMRQSIKEGQVEPLRAAR